MTKKKKIIEEIKPEVISTISGANSNPADINVNLEACTLTTYIPAESIEPKVVSLKSFNTFKNKVVTKDELANTDIKFKRLSPDAVIPEYAHEGDAGMDMTAISVEYDLEHDCYIYHTGIACASGFGIKANGMPRSSNCKTDCYLANGVGLIDSAIYRGEIQWRYKNRTSRTTRVMFNYLIMWNNRTLWQKILCTLSKKYKHSLIDAISQEAANTVDSTIMSYAPYAVGDRIGQLVFERYVHVSREIVDEFEGETSRGENGFGSTGN